jgi:hypothetical protein
MTTPVTRVQTGPAPPWRHDSVTTTCPACGRPYVPKGRQRWCSDACRAAAYRWHKSAAGPSVVLPSPRPRRPRTVYECDCAARRLVVSPAQPG